MAAITASRQAPDVYAIVGKSDIQGDPLKPSRLLFLCPDNELRERAGQLFASVDETVHEILQPSLQWKLKPPALNPPARMPVTAFKQYLACPFRYYLSHIVKMEHINDRKVEADAIDFGIACHHPLELLGANEELRACTGEHVLRAFLESEAEKFIKSKYGANLSLTLSIQLAAIKQRLGAAARIEATQRKQGWQTIATEYRPAQAQALHLNGMEIRGTIDRIDRRDDVVRILDYKTSDKPVDAQKAHVRKAAAGAPEYARFERGGKTWMWLDLQLPLYSLMLESNSDYAGIRIECGYFSMPKAVGDTAISVWQDFDRPYLESARRCAANIVDNVRNAVFWPPAKAVAYDMFEDLYTDSLERAVDADYFTKALINASVA
jgi:ATP-dependent helicase/nuclease subunit B